MCYNIDLNDHKIWERNTLILKLYNELTNDNLRNIYPAPPKQILKVFGGNIDIVNLDLKQIIATAADL